MKQLLIIWNLEGRVKSCLSINNWTSCAGGLLYEGKKLCVLNFTKDAWSNKNVDQLSILILNVPKSLSGNVRKSIYLSNHVLLCSPTTNNINNNNINTNIKVWFVNYNLFTHNVVLTSEAYYLITWDPAKYWPQKQTMSSYFLKRNTRVLPLDFLQFIFTMAYWTGVKSKKHDSRFGQFSNFLSIGKAVRPPNSQYFSLLLTEWREKCKSIKNSWNSYSDKRYTGFYWCRLKGSKAVLAWHGLL